MLKNEKKRELKKKTFTDVNQHITSHCIQLLVDKKIAAVIKSPQHCPEEQESKSFHRL